MKLAQLREQVAIDADLSEETLANLRDLQAVVGDREPTVHELAASGTYVRDIYQGVENVLLRLVTFHGLQRPDGADWHLTLLAMFADPPTAGLPTLFTRDSQNRIGKYRGFRHVFNKRYASRLRWVELKPLVGDLDSAYQDFQAAVTRHLESL